MAKNTRYGLIKVIATCPHCGNPIPVNGPLRRPVCGSCQEEAPIAVDDWQDILNEYESDYESLEAGSGNTTTSLGESTLKYSTVKLPPPDPVCPKCETDWDIEAVADGTDGTLTCKKCGYATPTFPAPAWLVEGVPTARQVFFAEREVAEPPGQAIDGHEEATRPIALACPQCNGSLLVTAEAERVMQCKYCKVDVYLPDPVWLKLHPAKVAKFWMVRFRG